MCHFLSIAVHGKAVPTVPPEFQRQIRFDRHTNRSVTKHAAEDWTWFTATSGGCSCDFYRLPGNPPESRSRLEQKYRKKGWSTAKVDRALENQDVPVRQGGLRDDILAMIAALVTRHREIRVALHWYEGKVETEDFSLTDIGKVSWDDFKRDSTHLQEEIVVTIFGERWHRNSPSLQW